MNNKMIHSFLTLCLICTGLINIKQVNADCIECYANPNVCENVIETMCAEIATANTCKNEGPEDFDFGIEIDKSATIVRQPKVAEAGPYTEFETVKNAAGEVQQGSCATRSACIWTLPGSCEPSGTPTDIHFKDEYEFSGICPAGQ